MVVQIKSLGIYGRPTGSSIKLLSQKTSSPAPTKPRALRVSTFNQKSYLPAAEAPKKDVRGSETTRQKSYLPSPEAPAPATKLRELALATSGSSYLWNFIPFSPAKPAAQATEFVEKITQLPMKYQDWRSEYYRKKQEAEREKLLVEQIQNAAVVEGGKPPYPVGEFDWRRLLPEYAYYSDQEQAEAVKLLYSPPPQTTTQPSSQSGYIPTAPIETASFLSKHGKTIAIAGAGIIVLAIILMAARGRK